MRRRRGCRPWRRDRLGHWACQIAENIVIAPRICRVRRLCAWCRCVKDVEVEEAATCLSGFWRRLLRLWLFKHAQLPCGVDRLWRGRLCLLQRMRHGMLRIGAE